MKKMMPNLGYDHHHSFLLVIIHLQQNLGSMVLCTTHDDQLLFLSSYVSNDFQ